MTHYGPSHYGPCQPGAYPTVLIDFPELRIPRLPPLSRLLDALV